MISTPEKLGEPFLCERECGRQEEGLNGLRYDVLKSRRRLRHCYSAPASEDGDPKKKPYGCPAKLNSGDGGGSSSMLLRAASVLAIYLGVGSICFFTIESELDGDRTNAFVDALYFCIVTMTTVGYGDLVPASMWAKLFTCGFVFVGFGLVGLLLGTALDFLVEKQEKLLVKALGKEKNSRYEDFSEFRQISRIRWKVAIAGALVLVSFTIGMLFLVKAEGMSLLDAFYCVCVTVTTLGYGDRSFHTVGGRIFAVVWILVSTICVGQFFLYIAELQTAGRRQYFVHWVLTRKTTLADLQVADMDSDGVVRPVL
eukprot:c24250_g1_i3 orf=364-1302(-)